MSMQITRNVILDLLPLYAAGEVSDDTRTLIDSYLKDDPELAEAARTAAALEAAKDAPNPIKKEDHMEAYDKAKRQIQMRIITLAFAIAAIFGIALIAVIFLFFGRAA